MLEGKALIEDTDMPVKMQMHAMAFASQALDIYDVFDCRSIAAHIKKVHFFFSFFFFPSLMFWHRVFPYCCLFIFHS